MIPDQVPTDDADRVLSGRLDRLAIAAGALLMLAIIAVSVLIAQRTVRESALAVRARAARMATSNTFDALLSAEAAQRGYLLTGRLSYLAPYTEAVARMPGFLRNLDAVKPDTPEIAVWHAIIDNKMAELAETVRLEKAGRHADALAVVLSDRGRIYMEAARAVSASLAARQRDALTSFLAHSEAGARLLVYVDTVALLQLALLAAFVGRSQVRTVRALRRGRADLMAANAALQSGRDRLEAAVAERTADLTQANDEIQRFAYIVSHDLRAPLLNIIGFTAELTDATARLNRFVSDNLEPAGIAVPADVREASQDDLPEAIRFIQTSTAKMDRLITAILRLSREGRRVMTPERLDMATLLAGIADSVHQLADAAGAEITIGTAPAFTSDRLAVEQVFSNLVENALKYLQPGRPGRITISGQVQGGWARYEVADNGRGIAARDLERIFELFRRAGPQDTTGEGIGLAHVRALLRRLGGAIVCESTQGVGSNFVVSLPAMLAYTPEVER